MNRYYVSVDVGVTVEADNPEEAEKKAYEVIGNLDDDGLGALDDYTIIGKPELKDTGIENVCFTCNKRDVGGSNDSMCPKCFKEWSARYERKKANKDYSD